MWLRLYTSVISVIKLATCCVYLYLLYKNYVLHVRITVFAHIKFPEIMLVDIWGHGVWILLSLWPWYYLQYKTGWLETTRKIVTEKGISEVSELSGDETLNKNVVNGNFISLFFYDNKPVYFMTNDCDRIKWLAKQHKVWCKSINKIVQLRFYCLNKFDEYNKKMKNYVHIDAMVWVSRNRWYGVSI